MNTVIFLIRFAESGNTKYYEDRIEDFQYAMNRQPRFVTDIFNNQYSVVGSLGNGLCGYHCLSYCLTGHQKNLFQVIEDCLRGISGNPPIFDNQMDRQYLPKISGKHQVNGVEWYVKNMVSKLKSMVMTGKEFIGSTQDLWLETAHLIAISKVVKVTVYLYNRHSHLSRPEWVVFNQMNTRGYICLQLVDDCHYEVLEGLGGTKPPQPASAQPGDEILDINGELGQWIDVVAKNVYSFMNVWSFESTFTLSGNMHSSEVEGERLVSGQQVLYQSTAACLSKSSEQIIYQSVSEISCIHDLSDKLLSNETSGNQRNENTSDSDISESSRSTSSRQCKVIHQCQQCPFRSGKQNALRMHVMRKHSAGSSMLNRPYESSIPTVSKLIAGISNADYPSSILQRTNTSGDEGNVNSSEGDISESSSSSRHFIYHQCPNCPYKSRKKTALQLHVMKKHGDRSCILSDSSSILNVSSDSASSMVEETSSQYFTSISAQLPITDEHQLPVSEVPAPLPSISLELSVGLRRSQRLQNSELLCNSVSDTKSQFKVPIALDGTKKSKLSCPRCNRKVINLSKHKICRPTDARSSIHSDLTMSRTACSVNLMCVEDCDNSFDSTPAIHRTQKRSEHLAVVSPKKKSHVNDERTNCQDSCEFSKDFSIEPISYSPTNSRLRHTATAVGQSPAKSVMEDRTEHSSEGRLHHKTELIGRILKEKLHALKNRYKPYNEEQMSCVDASYIALKTAHDNLERTLENLSTDKLSAEASELLTDASQIDAVGREFKLTENDAARLSNMTKMAKKLETPRFRWSAPDDSSQGQYNIKRLEFLYKEELVWRFVLCSKCGVRALLVGLDQIESTMCMDCIGLDRGKSDLKQKKMDAWENVKPRLLCPKKLLPDQTSQSNRMNIGQPVTSGDLKSPTPAERAVMALAHVVVEIQKHYCMAKTYRQHHILLKAKNPQSTWCKVLPRTHLHDRFVVLERRFSNAVKKYIYADPENVRQWLKYLFANHPEYIRLKEQNLLELSEEALDALRGSTELAKVICVGQDSPPSNGEQISRSNDLPPSADVDAGLSEVASYIFDNNQELYMKKDHVLRLEQDGLIEIVKENSERQYVYEPEVSANIAFPDLYPHGESTPTDCGQHSLARALLKKQTQWAQQNSKGYYRYPFAEDGVHMMNQYARVVEMNVRALVGWYIHQRPDRANIPVTSIMDAFREGINQDSMIDTEVVELHGLMAQIRNSRETWFAERLGIETISRDLGDPNVFLTINMDPRGWPDVRKLIHELEYGSEKPFDPDAYEYNTNEYTKLLEKYAVQINIYLHFKSKLFLRAFLCDICGIPNKEEYDDCTHPSDRSKTGWFWKRVEFTQTRGVQHWHCLAKLPNVLDTAILGRMVQNMRIIRLELKYGNIKPDHVEDAWKMIEVGLLASRYLCLFGESMSKASFFTSPMSIDEYDSKKVIHLKDHLGKYRQNYIEKTLNKKSNPAMRTLLDEDCCNCNIFEEEAEVAAMCCIHGCMQCVCGGDAKTGSGCRFDFPKKPQKFTVPTVVEISNQQVEIHLLLRRTEDRIPHLNKYFLRYFRANHDVSILVDAAHKMRYAAKYVSKSRKICVLMSEIIEFLQTRCASVVPPTVNQALVHLLLADCSHKAYMTKHELAYNVMDLPKVRKSFANVKVVGCYPRAVIIESAPNSPDGVVQLSDRTEYAAYAERLRETTIVQDRIINKFGNLTYMNFRTFAENINRKWVPKKKTKSQKHQNDSEASHADAGRSANGVSSDESTCDLPSGKRFCTRDASKGHWKLTLKKKPSHVRWSTVLYCEPAYAYEMQDPDDGTSQRRFFDLDVNRRRQLQRCYQELVCYVPWSNNPDEKFVSREVGEQLENDQSTDPDKGSRYSLKLLEEYYKYYMAEWVKGDHGIIAPVGSQWHRENQYNYTMYLANHHNRSVHSHRVENGGMFKATYVATEETEEGNENVRLNIVDDDVDADLPSATQFILPPDIYQEMMAKQSPPELSELHVAYPRQYQWQIKQEAAKRPVDNLFLAEPPSPDPTIRLSAMQRTSFDLIIRREKLKACEQIYYIYGKAGSGKTAVALHLCQYFKGRVQAAAGTGKAASNFNGPTIHGAFCWGINKCSYLSAPEKDREDDAASNPISTASEEKLKCLYRNVDVFVFDEINAVGANILGQIDEAMQRLFCERNRRTGKPIPVPFGGKTVIFMGDSAQLRPIGAPGIYDDHVLSKTSKVSQRTSNKQGVFIGRCQRGQMLYKEILARNVFLFQRGHRNFGLLEEIADRLRNGQQTQDDLGKLMFQRRKYPDFVADRGIHYSNQSASNYNCRRLWKTCQSKMPPKRMYICRASYESTGDNDTVINALSQVPSSKYNFAQDVLCLAEGCEVRLITNLDTSAGLVNSAIGTVVRLVYDDADVNALVNGELPPPNHIVVKFDAFRGRIQKKANIITGHQPVRQKQASSSPSLLRLFPHNNHKLVDIYRQKFQMTDQKALPAKTKRLQQSKLYREQFPLDNSENLTAHRGQGQTWSGSSLSIHLGLESPENYVPADVNAVIYVAITRVKQLKNLFMDPIFPSIWQKLGNSVHDVGRRAHEQQLVINATLMAKKYHFEQILSEELSAKPDFSNNAAEWEDLKNGATNCQPDSKTLLSDVSVESAYLDAEMEPKPRSPVLNQRYIGIDQGLKTFTMVAVDRMHDQLPRIVAVQQCNLLELGLGTRYKNTAENVWLLLRLETSLNGWLQMTQRPWQLPEVDQTVILLEQLSLFNGFSKSFGIELGKIIQLGVDQDTCIVQMSQPHVHRRTGPMFKLGDEVIAACQLQPASYNYKFAIFAEVAKQFDKTDYAFADADADVENEQQHEDIEDAEETRSSISLHSSYAKCTETRIVSSEVSERAAMRVARREYVKKKRMSHRLFEYFLKSSNIEQSSMQVTIDPAIQQRFLDNPDSMKKLDDYGDSLLHALNPILCGSSNYRQLLPASPISHNNRTVVLVVTPDKAYWVTFECIWNKIIIQGLGSCDMHLVNRTFKDQQSLAIIVEALTNDEPMLNAALTCWDIDESIPAHKNLTSTGHIKIVAKQLKNYAYLNLNGLAAGALTNATISALRIICDASAPNSSVCAKNNKKEGWVYIRTCERTGRKVQLIRSTGKHTNAMLACLELMKQDFNDFVVKRPLHMAKLDRIRFYDALCTMSTKPTNAGSSTWSLECIAISDKAHFDLRRCMLMGKVHLKLIYADLILIGLNQNQQYVSAVSCRQNPNSRPTLKPSKEQSHHHRKRRHDNPEELISDSSNIDSNAVNTTVVEHPSPPSFCKIARSSDCSSGLSVD
jgi:hypothetical protein